MNEGISLNEACFAGALTEESFNYLCKDDGSVKTQPETTTIHLKNDPSKSVTVQILHLQIGAIIVSILVIVGIVFLVKKLKK